MGRGADQEVLGLIAVELLRVRCRNHATKRPFSGALPLRMSSIRTKACANPECDNFDKCGQRIGCHGWFTTKTGRKRRYRCKICGATASTNTGTPYAGLRCTRNEFDQVAQMTVEGVGISATARIAGRSRSTIIRWRSRATKSAKNFNDRNLRNYEITELQADELCTFVGGKENVVWIFALIVVGTRVVGQNVVCASSIGSERSEAIGVGRTSALHAPLTGADAGCERGDGPSQRTGGRRPWLGERCER